MRAMICHSLGEASRLVPEEVAPPLLTEGGVRIAVAAAGLNFADLLLLAGRYQEKSAPPFSPGLEVAGRVVEVAKGVMGLKPGDRVMAVVDKGGLAEQVVAPLHDVTPIPESMPFAVAAGFPIAYGTSHHALKVRAGLKRGETLLVHGAAGGVGLTAVEVGKALGATVIATASTQEKLAVAEAHGASHLILSKDEDLKGKVKAATAGRGVDVVYDPVGGALFDASLRCAAPGARLLVIGFASGEVPQIPANLLLVKNLTAIGYYWGAYRSLDPKQVQESLRELIDWYRAGRIKPQISTEFALAQANEALDLLRRRGSTGKLVLEVDQNL